MYRSGIPLPPPLPPSRGVAPLGYFRADMDPGPAEWVTVARPPTTAQWHRAKAALSRGGIESLMGEGHDAESPDADPRDGIALKVMHSQQSRAAIILRANESGEEWCPRCGSVVPRELPLPWYWMLWSVLFLGVAPFAPPKLQCRECGHRWG